MKDRLDRFDHVVVVMLENRSFDNLLGGLYPDGVPAGAPLGKTFEGVTGRGLENPIPPDAPDNPSGKKSIALEETCDFHQPFPDPGESYPHVNTQLFDAIAGEDAAPYNLPPDVNPNAPAGMNGFVKDYIENFTRNEEKRSPTFGEYAEIMRYFGPKTVPVLSTLAREFAVFDHWFCSVPSQTWCNRAFWHAGTSWGHVVNGGSFGHGNFENSLGWFDDSKGRTLFNQLEEARGAGLSWKIYTDNLLPLTGILHFRALAEELTVERGHLGSFADFLDDCENGRLPSYSFVEPRFLTPHNDMHPSSAKGWIDGPQDAGSVLLGELFVWEIYEALRKSSSETGSNWQNTLLVITFDEHGGCFDHVSPPTGATPPDLSGYTRWMDFGYDRLGVRVPTIMVSAHIAKNTVVNAPMDHNSFMRTVQTKWSGVAPGQFPPLTARVAASPEFGAVFTSPEVRCRESWPELARPVIPNALEARDFSGMPLNELQSGLVGAALLLRDGPDAASRAPRCRTVGDAQRVLEEARKKLGWGSTH